MPQDSKSATQCFCDSLCIFLEWPVRGALHVKRHANSKEAVMLWGRYKKRSSSTSCSAGGLLWICSFLGCSGGDFWEDWCCKFVERGFLLSGKLRLKFPEALQVVVGCLRWQPVFSGHAKDKLLHWYGMSWYSRIERWPFCAAYSCRQVAEM